MICNLCQIYSVIILSNADMEYNLSGQTNKIVQVFMGNENLYIKT